MTTLNSSEANDDAGPIFRYVFTLNSPKQFTLVSKHLESKLSFWEVSRVLTDTKEVLSIESVGSFPEEIELSGSMLIPSVP